MMPEDQQFPDEVPDIPVSRDEEWSDYTPARDIDYKQYDGEFDRMLRAVKTADETGLIPRFRLIGPAGCGKTACGEALAHELDCPFFSVQGEYDTKRSSLVGYPVVMDDTTYWVDREIVQAMLASQEGKVVLLYDESDRTRPEAKAVLFPILDGRVSVRTGRGNEIIRGDPQNLIVVVTNNEGSNYNTQGSRVDLAEERRYGATFLVDYPAENDFDTEVEVITDQTPVPPLLARLMVLTATDVRLRCKEEESPVTKPIPTSMVVRWAQMALGYGKQGDPNPCVTAARDVVITPLYRDNGEAAEVVRNTVTSYLNGAPTEASQVTEWAEQSLYGEDGLDDDVLETAGIDEELGQKNLNAALQQDGDEAAADGGVEDALELDQS